MTAHCFGFLARLALRRLFVGAAQFHFAEYALALHFFLKRFQSLVDIVVADCNVNDGTSPDSSFSKLCKFDAAYIIACSPCEGAFGEL